jgi:hypothetical protein
LLLIVAAVAVWASASNLLVRFPADGLDLTAHATGSLTLQASPATGAPQSGSALPVDLRRRVHDIGGSNGNVLVQADDAETIGPLSPLHLTSRYVLDGDTGRNVSSPQAFAYTPANVVDRSGTFSVTFPFGAGNGPHPLWQDPTGTALPMTSSGRVRSNGLSLRRFSGRAQDLPLQPAFLAQLAPLGLLQTLPISQLGSQLTAAGVDPGTIEDAIAQLDVTADRTAATALFRPETQVPLAYSLTTDESLLVEPASGVVVSLERVVQTVAMTPQLSGLGRLQLILGQSHYAANPAVTAAAEALARLAAHPPATPVATVTYSQEPGSVAQVASYARNRAGSIQLWTRTIPIVLAVLGVLALLVGLLQIGRRRGERRRRGGAAASTGDAA